MTKTPIDSNKAIYAVSVLDKNEGHIELRGYRYVWIEPDGTQHVYHRDATLARIRTNIAAALRVPVKDIKLKYNKG